MSSREHECDICGKEFHCDGCDNERIFTRDECSHQSIRSLQYEINKMHDRIQKAIKESAVPRIFIPEKRCILKEKMEAEKNEFRNVEKI